MLISNSMGLMTTRIGTTGAAATANEQGANSLLVATRDLLDSRSGQGEFLANAYTQLEHALTAYSQDYLAPKERGNTTKNRSLSGFAGTGWEG